MSIVYVVTPNQHRNQLWVVRDHRTQRPIGFIFKKRHLFWIMHQTTQLGTLSKRDLTFSQHNLLHTGASASSFSLFCCDGLSLVQSQLVGDFYPTCVKLGAQGRKSFDPKLSCVISEMDIDNRYRRTYFSEIRIVVGIMGIRIQDLR